MTRNDLCRYCLDQLLPSVPDKSLALSIFGKRLKRGVCFKNLKHKTRWNYPPPKCLYPAEYVQCQQPLKPH